LSENWLEPLEFISENPSGVSSNAYTYCTSRNCLEK